MSTISLGALNTGTIRVLPGEAVGVNRARFRYWGRRQTMYLCWGLKRRGVVGFSNGLGLEGGFYNAQPIEVPESNGSMIDVVFPVVGGYFIDPSIPPATYDTYIWLSTDVNDLKNEVNFIRRKGSSNGLIDTDAGVIEVIKPATEHAGNEFDKDSLVWEEEGKTGIPINRGGIVNIGILVNWRGSGGTWDVGIGLAPRVEGLFAWGHNNIVAFISGAYYVAPKGEWVTLKFSLAGAIPSDLPPGTYDILKFVQVAGGPRDPGGDGYFAAKWSDDVFVVR